MISAMRGFFARLEEFNLNSAAFKGAQALKGGILHKFAIINL